jgi:hypothetical protein
MSKALKKNGRPTVYSATTADTICRRLTEGETLVHICRDKDMPTRSTVHLWRDTVEGFSDRYVRARERQAETWADEIIDIADDSAADTIHTDHGQKADNEWINRSKLRVQTRQWLMGKAAPKQFGDKVSHEHGTQDGKPIEVDVKYTDIEVARRLAFVLARGARAAKDIDNGK